MNPDTITLIERPYQEIVDDILTAMVGGVVREPIFFDVKEDLYPLSTSATTVRGITGSILAPDGLSTVHYVFLKEVDFTFDAGHNAVVWLKGGQQPADESTFYVDYFRPDSTSPLTDINIGSVTRTVSEAIGREIATVYQQINQAYRSGFVDTATGQALELVVSILGILRKTKNFATGLVTFFRDQTVGDGSIAIPEGTLLSTTKGDATFVTDELRILQRGQVRVDVPIRASDASKGQVGIVPAGAITTLAQAMIGINRVTNFDATILGNTDETDEQLRARAKAVLRGTGKATLAALLEIILEEGATLTEVWDPNSVAPNSSFPGTFVLQLQAEPEQFLSIQSSVNETRAAGVQATLVAKYVYVTPRLVLTVASSGLTAAGQLKLLNQVIAAIQQYVDSLKVGALATGAAIVSAIVNGGIKEITNANQIKFADVLAARSDISSPVADALAGSLVDAVLNVIASASLADPTTLSQVLSNPAALRKVLSDAIDSHVPLPPTSQRIPDRGAVQNLNGQRASDTDIESGQFQVNPSVNGDSQWQIVLEMAPDDIALS
ncbi:MAG: baseplate J/gp47 family protein [Ktedonobacteraceae bacterium]